MTQIDLRLGDWREVLADVESVDAVICDPPYSATTHAGALDATTGERGVNGYDCLTVSGAVEFCELWASRCSGWVVIHIDDVLGPTMREAMLGVGRYAFPLLPVLQQQPRVTGDGPSQHGHYLAISRPKERRFLSWGSLPGWYECLRDGSIVRGGKPLLLMRAIIRDYTKPGDLVCDPCAGGATTLIAAAEQGRRAIGAEVDPETHAKAMKRIARGYTPDMFPEQAQR
jgi:site-specific DNA-methyltransferase (adenine-specific)